MQGATKCKTAFEFSVLPLYPSVLPGQYSTEFSLYSPGSPPHPPNKLQEGCIGSEEEDDWGFNSEDKPSGRYELCYRFWLVSLKLFIRSCALYVCNILAVEVACM